MKLFYFGWRNVGAAPQISLNFQTLAQRWPNCDIQTAIIPTTIQRWANRKIQITIIEKMYNFKITNIIKER